MSKKVIAALSLSLVLAACNATGDLTNDEAMMDDDSIMMDESSSSESSDSSDSSDSSSSDAAVEVEGETTIDVVQ